MREGRKETAPRWQRVALLTGTAIIILLLSAAAFVVSGQILRGRTKEVFLDQATGLASRIRAALDIDLQVLEAAAVLSAPQTHSPVDFAQLTARLQNRFPSLSDLKLIPVSAASQSPDLPAVDKGSIPPEIVARAAAAFSGNAKKMRPKMFTAASSPGARRAVFIAVPIYSEESDIQPAAVLLAAVDLPGLLPFLRVDVPDFDIAIYTSEDGSEPELLYARTSFPLPLVTRTASAAPPDDLVFQTTLELGDLTWHVVARPLAAPDDVTPFVMSSAVAAATIFLSMLAAVGIYAVWQHSERVRAEERESLRKLYNANARFSSALQAVPEPLLFVDETGSIVEIDGPFQHMFGYTPAEMIGQPIERLLPGAARQKHASLRANYMRAPNIRHMGSGREFSALTKDGRELSVEITLSPITTEDGSVVAAIVRDISARKKAEENLKRSEQLLTASQRISQVGSWEIDLEAGTVSRSYELLRIFGLEHESVTRSVAEVTEANLMLVHPDDRSVYLKGLADASVSGRISHHEYRIIVGSEIKHIRAFSEPILDDNDKLVRVVGTSQDVTKQKDFEDRLRHNEQRLNEAQRVARVGSWEHLPASNQIYWTAGLYEIFEIDPSAEILTPQSAGEIIMDTAHPEDRGLLEALASVYENASNSESFELEHRLLMPDGRIKYLLSRISREYNARGEVTRAMGVVQDITERKLAELEIENRETQLSILTDSLPVFIAYADVNESLLFLNRTGAEWCGRSRAELIGCQLSELGDRASYEKMEPLRRRVLAGETIYAEDQVAFRDGRARWVAMQFVPDKGADEAVRGFYLLISDIDDRKRMERQLVHGQKMDAIGQLTGGVAHDFNNILTVIHGNLQLVDTSSLDPAIASRLERAIAACVQAGDLVSRLLTFARQQDLKPDVIAVCELIRNIVQLLRGTIPEDIDLITRIPKDRIFTRADPSQLESALVNLCLNARDAMPTGGRITVSAEEVDHIPGDRRGRFVRVSVSDTGIGMDEAVKRRALEPFFTTKDFGKGSGLGLSMVHGFAEQSDGTVDIESEVGVGSTVSLYLPACDAGESRPEKSSRVTTKDNAEQTVLVVEDRVELREMVSSFLGTLGYRVLEAGSGGDALEIMEKGRRVDLLFTDIVMPGGMNGIELAQLVKTRFPGVSTLFTTGYVRDSDASPLGTTSHILRKPYALSELAAAVSKALARGAPL